MDNIEKELCNIKNKANLLGINKIRAACIYFKQFDLEPIAMLDLIVRTQLASFSEVISLLTFKNDKIAFKNHNIALEYPELSILINNMDFLFSNYEEQEDLDLSAFDTRNVTSMTGVFHFCDKLRNINLKSFNTRKVESMQMMFVSCVSLKQLDLSNFDTSNVSNFDSMFYRNRDLKMLDISHFSDCSVGQKLDIKDMFKGTEALKKVKFPEIGADKIKKSYNDSHNLN